MSLPTLLSALMMMTPTPAIQQVAPLVTLGNGRWNVHSHVSCIAIGPQGVICSTTLGSHYAQDKNAHLLNLGTGERSGELTGHDGFVLGCAVTEDGSVMTISSDGTVRWWNTTKKVELSEFRAISRQAFDAICASPSRRTLLAISAEGRLFTIQKGMPRIRIIDHAFTLPVDHAAITDDGSRVANVCAPSTVYVCAAAGKHLCDAMLSGKPISRCSFDARGRLWVFAEWHREDARAFELVAANNGKCALKEVAHLPCYWPASFDSKGRLAALDKQERVVVYDANGEVAFATRPCKDRVTAIDLTADVLVYGDGAGNCWAYDSRTGREITKPKPLECMPVSLCFDGTGERLFIGTQTATIVEWDIVRQASRELLALGSGTVSDLQYDPIGRCIYACTENEYRGDKSHSCIRKLTPRDGRESKIEEVCVLPNGIRCLALLDSEKGLVGGKKAMLTQVNLVNGTVTGRIDTGVPGYFTAIALSGDKQCAMVQFGPAYVVQIEGDLSKHEDSVRATVVGKNASANSRLDARHGCFVGYDDGQVGYWDTKARAEKWRRKALDDSIAFVEGADTGRGLIVVSGRGTIATATIGRFQETLRVRHQGVEISVATMDERRELLAVGRVNGTVDVFTVKSLFSDVTHQER